MTPLTETTLRNALDGAEVVKFHPDRPLFVAWHGGVTFNVYAYDPHGDTPVREVDVFSNSDGEGRPLAREAAKEAVADRLERVD